MVNKPLGLISGVYIRGGGWLANNDLWHAIQYHWQHFLFVKWHNEESCLLSTCHTFSILAAVRRWCFKTLNVYSFKSGDCMFLALESGNIYHWILKFVIFFLKKIMGKSIQLVQLGSLLTVELLFGVNFLYLLRPSGSWEVSEDMSLLYPTAMCNIIY